MRDALPPLPEKTIKQFTDHKDLGFIQVRANSECYTVRTGTAHRCPVIVCCIFGTRALLHCRTHNQ
jgi:hypothetical protein